MMGWIYLIVVVVGNAALWPIGRWAMQGGKATVLGFWASLSCAGIGLLSVSLTGGHFGSWPVWLSSGLMSIAYAVGFCALIMQCLKIGPAGPTATVNNMAMVCGVLYGMLWLEPHQPSGLVILGVICTCLALILIGAAKPGENKPAAVPREWLPMVLAGGAFSGLSFMTQTYIAVRQPQAIYQYLTLGFGLSALMLLPALLTNLPVRSRRRECIGGLAIGSLTGLLMPLSLKAVGYLGSAVVFPITVTVPVIAVLIIGHFLYHEKLDRLQLAGSLTGVFAVLLLALGSGS